MTGALSPSHWVILLVVVLLLFGAKRLPDMARGLGSSMRIFKAETAAMSAENAQGPGEARTDAAAPQPAVAPAPAPAVPSAPAATAAPATSEAVRAPGTAA